MLKLIIPSYKKFLPLLNSFINVSSEVFDVHQIQDKIELCAEEAFVYILKNSYRGEEGDIEISIEVNERYFILSFIDSGLPIDIAFPSVSAKSIQSVDTQTLELLLIKQFSHKAEWINHGKEGREFKFYFELPQQAIYTLPETADDESLEVSIDDIEIRQFEKRWAMEISQIIYKAYGYSYPNEDLYFPERIIALNESGQLVSVVAYDTKKNRIAGHYALEREDLGSVAEIGQAVVVPSYRGLGLMKKIRLKTQEIGRELGLEGIMSKPVTVHLFSQKTNEALGAVPVGMGFGVSPVKTFKKIEADASQRGSCMYYYLPLKNRERVLSVPQKHRQITETIYEDLKLDYVLQVKEGTVRKNGTVKSAYAPNFEVGSIFVTSIGEDNIRYIKEAFFNLLFRMKAKVVLLYVVMEDLNVETLIAQVEEEKFFFSGILPSLTEGKDVLVYEFLPENIDESKVEIYSDRAKELVQYISNEKRKVL
ncbi:GNAT family N-acetyltransferase [Sulfurovum sp.]|uniref:GNAT family N-acetyltransferase n=1 Tax=Sulfurovum sp. TaxID=1969726 RepID=UPI0025D331F3|nr:GNAT family N-acetyltransferase [Sulfurovum sp.]